MRAITAFLLLSGWAGLAFAGEPKSATNSQANPTRPLNVLFLMTDQHHAQWLGAAGNPVAKTPNLDRLAKGGTRFTEMFVPVPYCSPTRAAIVTGLYPSSLGIGRNIRENDDPLRFREPRQIYQHQLAALGYHCYQLGKWHLGSPGELNCFAEDAASGKAFRKLLAERRKAAGTKALDNGPRDGESKATPALSPYEAAVPDDGLRLGETELVGDVYLRKEIAEAHRRWREEKGTPKQDVGVIGRSRVKPEYQYESVLADHCIELIKRHRNEPFAITYSVSPPHAPWVAPAPFYDMYDPQKLPLPTSWQNQPKGWVDSASARMGRIYGEAGLREYLRCYYAQVSMMDWCIGRILDTLDELKLADRTLVIFTSDHGNMLGQHGMMDKTHGTFYDDLMRVPLLMRLSGVIPAGKTSDALISSVDFAPTILDYLDATPLAKVHGRSLRSVIAGQPDGRQAVFGERGEPNSPAAARMIRTRQWKLCLLPKGARELYNLEKDPNETKNVADDPANAAVIRQLEKQLRAHMEAVDDPAARLLQRT